jgi:hypothetical protein
MAYGVQATMDAEGRPVMPVIADIAALNRNRERIGQPPLAASLAMMRAKAVYLDDAGRLAEPTGAGATGLEQLDIAAACREPKTGLEQAGGYEPALGAALTAAAAADPAALTAWTSSAPKWKRDLIGRVVLAISSAPPAGVDSETAVCDRRALYDGMIAGLPADDDLRIVLMNTLAYSLVARAAPPDDGAMRRAAELTEPLAVAITRPEVRGSGLGQGIIDTVACVRFRQGRYDEAAALWRDLLQLQAQGAERALYQRRLAAAEAKAATGDLPR